MRTLLLALFAALTATSAFAQITVTNPWVRATVPHQKATGAFMQITAVQGARLVDARSPAAGSVEIHEMSLQENVMKMRAIPSLELPAGKQVELKPGGYHLMFFDLKQPIKEGDVVPVTLIVEGKDKRREAVELQVPARAMHGAPATGNQAH
ncbi:MAG TPA: copper chaperone PCu(A)C [Noviherbaspirillum sp.]|nr:copper chaperone PCu(A)C [Noviherbaspirillum sp.]